MQPVRKILTLISVFVPLFLASACATLTRPPAAGEPGAKGLGSFETKERSRIAEYAESLVGQMQLETLGRWFRSDCSGYIVGVFRSLGYRVVIEPSPFDSSVSQAIFDTLQRRRLVYTGRRPLIGDLAFFKGTTEKRRYLISHIGIVTGVEEDGTVEIVHYTSSRGVQTLRMNLRTPGVYKDRRGRVINDFLKKGPGDTLSGQLFYAYGNLFRHVADRRRL
ncbi:MAG: hypothetical protein JXQ30_02275 [Spirochaetes bacterium]|nr:hypothetical protein [Spirochaetota bacterium]